MTMTMRCQRKISFTKKSAACPAFPHQVHGPGQGARAWEYPSIHTSILAWEAATAGGQMSSTQKEEKKGIKGNNGVNDRKWEGEEKVNDKRKNKSSFIHFCWHEVQKYKSTKHLRGKKLFWKGECQSVLTFINCFYTPHLPPHLTPMSKTKKEVREYDVREKGGGGDGEGLSQA